MKIFEFTDYKEFVRFRIEAMPNKGRGQFRQLAEALRMHTTLVSQVFNGDRNLTLEQACELSQFWGLNELETEMMLALVQYERAGTDLLKQALQLQIESIRNKADQLVHRLPKDKELSEQDQAIFYSNWYYSGIRLLTSVPSLRSIDALAEHLNLPKPLVSRVVSFLLETGLCVEKNGEITMGPQRTHLSSESPLITRHHMNWRVKEIEKVDTLDPKELMFTAPMSISHKDSRKVRKAILNFADEISDIVSKTKPEKLSCLNVSWFDI